MSAATTATTAAAAVAAIGLPDEQKTIETKVVILGHTGVGKTSLVNQYCRGQFLGNPTATIGAAFMKKTISLNNWTIILQIWDTAGQERFRSMAPMYYRGAHAAILVFDVSVPDTLDKVSGWVEELQGHANEDSIIVLAANKSDLRGGPTECVSAAAAAAYAKTISATVFETSAKTAKGIDEMFAHIARGLLANELTRRKQKDDQAAASAAAAKHHATATAAAAAASGSGGSASNGTTGAVKLDADSNRPPPSRCCGS